MPTYDYECSACGHTFDAFQSMSENPLRKCPRCGKNTLKRLIGAGLGIIFKGSGFYVNDSRSASSSTVTSKSDASSAKTDGGSKSEGAAKSDGGAKTDSGGSAAKSEPSKVAG